MAIVNNFFNYFLLFFTGMLSVDWHKLWRGDFMKLKRFKPYFLWVLLVEAIGFLASLLTRKGSEEFNMYAEQPPLTPPEPVFPIVWGILYALMGISAARIWIAPESTERSRGLNLFIIQLVLNFFWTLIFFNAQAYGAAVIVLLLLWVAVLLMILQFWKVERWAGLLQIPYLLWLTFAAYLNIGVWLLN
jgi:tryptophan-rich sensory protein